MIALHASAALFHHFWRRDNTLNAMLPQGMRRQFPSEPDVDDRLDARPVNLVVNDKFLVTRE
jgi:hypothetical protein